MRYRLPIFLVILSLFMVSGCAQPPETLEGFYPRGDVAALRIYYRQVDAAASYAFGRGDAGFEPFLDALYACAPAQALPEAYSPELRATHRIALSGAEGEKSLYYDDAAQQFFIEREVKRGDERVKTYAAFDAPLSRELSAYQDMVSVPFHAAEEAPLQIDPILRGEVIQEELDKPGENIDYEAFPYAHEAEGSRYAVLTYLDGVEGLENGSLLFVAATGRRPTGGYEIDIASIQVNEQYYVVRVWRDSPAEGADVTDQPTYPCVAAKVDARRVMEKKIVVFVGENGEILAVTRIDREFLENIPADMPPLATPEVFEDDGGG